MLKNSNKLCCERNIPYVYKTIVLRNRLRLSFSARDDPRYLNLALRFPGVSCRELFYSDSLITFLSAASSRRITLKETTVTLTIEPRLRMRFRYSCIISHRAGIEFWLRQV